MRLMREVWRRPSQAMQLDATTSYVKRARYDKRCFEQTPVVDLWYPCQSFKRPQYGYVAHIYQSCPPVLVSRSRDIDCLSTTSMVSCRQALSLTNFRS